MHAYLTRGWSNGSDTIVLAVVPDGPTEELALKDHAAKFGLVLDPMSGNCEHRIEIKLRDGWTDATEAPKP